MGLFSGNFFQNLGNISAVFSVGGAVIGEIESDDAALLAGQPFTVTAPAIKTYIQGKHVEIDVTVSVKPA
jgi:hypothetical protein